MTNADRIEPSAVYCRSQGWVAGDIIEGSSEMDRAWFRIDFIGDKLILFSQIAHQNYGWTVKPFNGKSQPCDDFRGQEKWRKVGSGDWFPPAKPPMPGEEESMVGVATEPELKAEPPPEQLSPLASDMLAGLSEFCDTLASGEPIAAKFRVTTVQRREDGTVGRVEYIPKPDGDDGDA